MLPELDALECFEAAATHLNFRRAARQVALSPTAFTGKMQRLEAALGYRLFERTTRSVQLTAEGAAALPQVRRTLDEARRCAEVIRPGQPAAPFTLKLGTRFELGLSWLVPALKPLRRERPQRRLSLIFGDSAELLLRLREGLLDAAVTSVRLTQPWVRYATLHDEDYVFVRKPGTWPELKSWRDAPKVTLVDTLEGLPLFRYFLDASPASETWQFGEVEHVGAIAAVRARLLEGAGVAVLPRYFVAADLAAKRLEPLFTRRTLQRDAFRLIWREGHPLESELQRLAEWLRGWPLR